MDCNSRHKDLWNSGYTRHLFYQGNGDILVDDILLLQQFRFPFFELLLVFGDRSCNARDSGLTQTK